MGTSSTDWVPSQLTQKCGCCNDFLLEDTFQNFYHFFDFIVVRENSFDKAQPGAPHLSVLVSQKL
jgi:hypothetical protein